MIWKLLNIISSLSNKSENVKGSETEVTRDFVFEPPQATIGLQRSTLPDAEGHCCTALFVFYGSDLIYITAPFK